MNCRRVRSQLSAYIDSELTGYEMLALRDHLSHCRECRDEHYSLKTMKYLLSALPEKEPNPDWVVLLAESISRPTPTLSQRLRAHWEQSLDAAASLFTAKVGRGGALAQNRRLVSALVMSAVGVFLITMPFDRHSARQATNNDAARMPSVQPVSTASFAPSFTSDRSTGPRSVPAGAIELIPIPLPPAPLAGGTTNLMPSGDLVRPEQPSYRDSYLNSINMHVIPPPGGMSGFGAPLMGPRLAPATLGGR